VLRRVVLRRVVLRRVVLRRAVPRRAWVRLRASIDPMTVIKINAITVPADSGDALAQRFAARAGSVDDQDGFEGFELLQPTDERHVWLVFGHGHRSAQERAGGDAPPSVGVHSELWSYTIAGGSTGSADSTGSAGT
jgi:heme-degrading monooxygenase HmoA